MKFTHLFIVLFALQATRGSVIVEQRHDHVKSGGKPIGTAMPQRQAQKSMYPRLSVPAYDYSNDASNIQPAVSGSLLRMSSPPPASDKKCCSLSPCNCSTLGKICAATTFAALVIPSLVALVYLQITFGGKRFMFFEPDAINYDTIITTMSTVTGSKGWSLSIKGGVFIAIVMFILCLCYCCMGGRRTYTRRIRKTFHPSRCSPLPPSVPITSPRSAYPSSTVPVTSPLSGYPHNRVPVASSKYPYPRSPQLKYYSPTQPYMVHRV